MKCQLFVDILLLIGIVCLFTECNGRRTKHVNKVKTDDSYNINYYIDTIDNHVILSTVVSSTNSTNLSISTLELK